MTKPTQQKDTRTDDPGPTNNAGMIIAPKADFARLKSDALTGELVSPEIIALFTGVDGLKWKGISINGFIAPLAGNMVVGKVIELIEVPTQYAKPGEPPMRKAAVIEGFSWQFMQDTRPWTSSKQDPPYNDQNWGLCRGTYMLGMMAFAARLDECKGRIVRISFGPYLPGSRTRKVAELEVLDGEAQAKVQQYLDA